MIEFHRTMDDHAREVWRVRKSTNGIDRMHWDTDCGAAMLGHIMWHPGRAPHFSPADIQPLLDLAELEAIARELRAYARP